MILIDYDNPNEDELEAAFREVYYFVQNFPLPVRFLVWLIIRIMGDNLYFLVAKKMHRATMSTLQDAAIGMHRDFFERKRKEREEIRKMSKEFVRSEVIE